MLYDVVYQGIYCLTVSASSLNEAYQQAFDRLGVDSDDEVELYETDESNPGSRPNSIPVR